MTRVREFLRVRFSKQGDIRFISHRDLLRLFERALRRAHLPVAMSQGYNPRPRISLPVPLSVGIVGRNEVLHFELDEWVRPQEAKHRLAAQLPEGIVLRSLRSSPVKPDGSVRELSYRVRLLRGHSVTQRSVDELLAGEEIVVHRHRDGEARRLNIGPFLRDVRLNEEELLMLVGASEQGTARPEEVLEALGCKPGKDYQKGAIERTHVSLPSSLWRRGRDGQSVDVDQCR